MRPVQTKRFQPCLFLEADEQNEFFKSGNGNNGCPSFNDRLDLNRALCNCILIFDVGTKLQLNKVILLDGKRCGRGPGADRQPRLPLQLKGAL